MTTTPPTTTNTTATFASQMTTVMDSSVGIFQEETSSTLDGMETDYTIEYNRNNYTQIPADNDTEDNLTPSTKGSTTSFGYGEVLRTSVILIGGLFTIVTGSVKIILF